MQLESAGHTNVKAKFSVIHHPALLGFVLKFFCAVSGIPLNVAYISACNNGLSWERVDHSPLWREYRIYGRLGKGHPTISNR